MVELQAIYVYSSMFLKMVIAFLAWPHCWDDHHGSTLSGWGSWQIRTWYGQNCRPPNLQILGKSPWKPRWCRAARRRWGGLVTGKAAGIQSKGKNMKKQWFPVQHSEFLYDLNLHCIGEKQASRTKIRVLRFFSWLVVWNIFYFSIQLGMSSSQLTNSYFSEA